MEKELYHHGVKGQKWGVRRYQKKDGSRIGGRLKRKDSRSEDYKTAKMIKKKKISQMSNADLRKLNERKELERKYRQLNPNAVSRGFKYAATAAGGMGTIIALKNNSAQIITIGKKFIGV